MHKLAAQSLEADARVPVRPLIFLVVLAVAVVSGCGDSGGSKQEYAYVTNPDAELRDRVAAVSNRTGMLHNGDRVIILEKMQGRHYVRVRSPRGEEGWIAERYLTDQHTYDQFQHLGEQFKNTAAQGVATTTRAVNLHVTPGRKTEHLYQLSENEKVDLLQREVVDKNAPATPQKQKEAEPESGEEPTKPGEAPIPEDWWLIRDSQKRVGWVLGHMLYMDVPIEVAQYAEGQRIVAFFVLDQVQDGGKNVPEYLMLLTEPKDGLPYDYDQVRVFTWNVRRHRYEGAFRDHGLSGFLPVTVGHENFDKEGDLQTFTLRLADETGQIHEQKYKFMPPIVRAVLGPGETTPKVHRKPAPVRRKHS